MYASLSHVDLHFDPHVTVEPEENKINIALFKQGSFLQFTLDEWNLLAVRVEAARGVTT